MREIKEMVTELKNIEAELIEEISELHKNAESAGNLILAKKHIEKAVFRLSLSGYSLPAES